MWALTPRRQEHAFRRSALVQNIALLDRRPMQDTAPSSAGPYRVPGTGRMLYHPPRRNRPERGTKASCARTEAMANSRRSCTYIRVRVFGRLYFLVVESESLTCHSTMHMHTQYLESTYMHLTTTIIITMIQIPGMVLADDPVSSGSAFIAVTSRSHTACGSA